MLKQMMSPGFQVTSVSLKNETGPSAGPCGPQSGRTIIEWFCILLQTIERKTRVRQNWVMEDVWTCCSRGYRCMTKPRLQSGNHLGQIQSATNGWKSEQRGTG